MACRALLVNILTQTSEAAQRKRLNSKGKEFSQQRENVQSVSCSYRIHGWTVRPHMEKNALPHRMKNSRRPAMHCFMLFRRKPPTSIREIGRASCRETVCTDV